MKASSKLRLVLAALFAAALACSAPGAAAPTAQPTATPAPTLTPTTPPSPTPPPTDTSTPAATATATPTKTATPLPPTDTPTPGPGDVFYNTDFDNFAGWVAQPLQKTGRMTTEIRDGRFLVQIDSQFTYGYAFYRGQDLGFDDMAVETSAQRTGGTNRNNISLVCRGSQDGWYEFSITSGGLYNILRFDDPTGNYTLLASGGSAAIQMQDRPNKLKAICDGDSLTWIVNDETLVTAHDSRLSHGDRFGLSVSTFNIGHVGVEFDYFTVSRP